MSEGTAFRYSHLQHGGLPGLGYGGAKCRVMAADSAIATKPRAPLTRDAFLSPCARYRGQEALWISLLLRIPGRPH